MLENNAEKLIKISVQGEAQHPYVGSPYRIDKEGRAHIVTATGGIIYNVQMGDSAMGWEADHLEPGVSVKNTEKLYNAALNLYACLGNEAKLMSGEAKGKKGFVIGIHGGVDHVMVHFPEDVLEDMALGDKIRIKGFGLGLKLDNYPDIHVMNIDPSLLMKLGVAEDGEKLKVPVTHVIPPYLMGSGIGTSTATKGDYDIMTTDSEEVEKINLSTLRLGDVVMIKDWSNNYGRAYLKGAVTIGVVIHGDSLKMGHGPGVQVVMTAATDLIEGIITPDANIANYLGIK
ncbi:DUF4438 domain-containing protein [Candidatus Uabimicrobium amorphum]|uniref:DUF4438 domain-containing protein n=1 Tax=Uabimicrobium amorphum TaxID=2596890 RepID=A0A5S9F4Q7_UABAM|nr:DUF4438 domain-containing protein [Candidatus Uabimicrobium amorphum]BBM85808.1 DUF4438 domain-containing protein [Candidatus Uabimicrobium amorphum]